MDFKPGDTHKCRIGNRNYKIHISAVVDDCMVVYKWYSKHKQRWHYEVKWASYLESHILLSAEKPDK